MKETIGLQYQLHILLIYLCGGERYYITTVNNWP